MTFFRASAPLLPLKKATEQLGSSVSSISQRDWGGLWVEFACSPCVFCAGYFRVFSHNRKTYIIRMIGDSYSCLYIPVSPVCVFLFLSLWVLGWTPITQSRYKTGCEAGCVEHTRPLLDMTNNCLTPCLLEQCTGQCRGYLNGSNSKCFFIFGHDWGLISRLDRTLMCFSIESIWQLREPRVAHDTMCNSWYELVRSNGMSSPFIGKQQNGLTQW